MTLRQAKDRSLPVIQRMWLRLEIHRLTDKLEGLRIKANSDDFAHFVEVPYVMAEIGVLRERLHDMEFLALVK